MNRNYKWLVCTQCYTFNHAKYITDTMNGFTMQQTTFPFICVIVDDDSTDGEPEVIKNYLTEHFHEPYRIEETEYANIICARHKSNPNCEFVVFLLKYNHYRIKKPKFQYLSEWVNTKYHSLCEGDDYWTYPGKLQEQVSFLEDHPDYSMCYAKCRYFYQSKGTFDHETYGGPSVEFKDLLRGNKIPTLTTTVRSDIYAEYRRLYVGTDVSKGWLMGDLPLWLYCSTKGRICFMEKEMGVYRVLQNSASHSQSFQKKLDFSMSMIDIMEYFNKTYQGGYTPLYFSRLRSTLRLRTFAIFGNAVGYFKELCIIAKKDTGFLFNKKAYMYLSFFILPKNIRDSKK